MGVSRSAVSQTIRRLEEMLGLALVLRTTRSVSLTEAGEGLYANIAPAIASMSAAVEQAGELRESPNGLLRLAVSSRTEDFLSRPLLAGFTAAYPDVHLDVVVTDEEFDIVAEGYDATVRLGEVIDEDMIIVPISGDVRQLAVCSPDYLKGRASPLTRRNWRITGALAGGRLRAAPIAGVCAGRAGIQRRGGAGNHHQ